jgi:hypothetical protein
MMLLMVFHAACNIFIYHMPDVPCSMKYIINHMLDVPCNMKYIINHMLDVPVT